MSIARLGVFAWLLLLPPPPAAGSQPGQQENVRRATLPNGLRVVAVRSSLAPVATTIITYLVGANEGPEGFSGMAHAQEHMMFRGSPGLSGVQISRIAAGLGGNYNAVATPTVTQYFFTVPADDFDVVLQLEAIRMQSVLDSQTLWEKERGAIQQEVAQNMSNPEYVASLKVLASLFEGSPYAHDSLGTSASFDKTTGAMLQAFHRTWYAPNNAVIVVVGDVEPERAIAEAHKRFASLAAKKIPEKTKIDLEPVKPATFELETDRPNGLVAVSFRLPGSDSADFAPATVLADMLASKSGDLHALVAQGKALSADFSFDPLPAAGIGSVRAAFPKGGDSGRLTVEVREVLSRLTRSGVAPDAVEAAKRRQILRAEIEKSSVSGLAGAWARAVAIEGRASPDDDLEAIRKVTPADVDRVARRYLDLDHAVVCVLTPRSTGKPARPEPPPSSDSSMTEKKASSVSVPKWAAKALRRTSVPVSSVHPFVSVLPNRLELIVQTQSVSRAVFVSGQVKTEPSLEVPQGKEGVHEALGQLFSFGTTSLDRVAFQRALDEIGAEESAGAEFSLRVLADDFDRGVELLADNLLRPALPEESFRTVQRQLAASVAGQLESPDYLSARALRVALLPAGDPRLRETTPATVEALKLGNLRDYYRKSFRPDLTKIVVVGNVSAEHVRDVFAQRFAAWKADGPPPEVLLAPIPPNPPSSVTVQDATRVQSNVTLAQTLGLTRSDPDYYALELGNRVLVGAFNASRLYRDLRDETGLVYSVSSTLDVRKTRSFYAVRFACDPGNVSRAREIVVRNLEQMRTTLVSPDELDRARALLLHEIPFSESSVEGTAAGLLWRASERLPLDEPTRAARRYVALSAEEVRAAFAKWIRPRDLVEATQGPTSK